jgi:hypothetical protein
MAVDPRATNPGGRPRRSYQASADWTYRELLQTYRELSQTYREPSETDSQLSRTDG